MPVRTKRVPDAFCDTCNSQNGVVTCANCGGVFCEKHSVIIRIKRVHNGRVYGELYRALCDTCLEKAPDIAYIIAGKPANAWDEHYCAETGERRAEMIQGVKERIDEADSQG